MPKIVDHDQYRKELLSQCFELFAQHGYAAITMRQIAQGLGVSTGTLYHYFPSKESLFEQLLEELMHQDLLSVTAELEDLPTLSQRIEAAFNFMARSEDRFLKQILIFVDFYQHQSRQPEPASRPLKQIGDKTRQSIADLLGIQDPQLINLILAVVDGLILQRLYGEDPVSFSEQGILLGKMLTAYLAQPSQIEEKR